MLYRSSPLISSFKIAQKSSQERMNLPTVLTDECHLTFKETSQKHVRSWARKRRVILHADVQSFCGIRIWRSERFFSLARDVFLALAGRRFVWAWAEETSGPEAHSTCYTDEEPWTDQWRTWHSFLWTPYSCNDKNLYYCFHDYTVFILNI